MITAANELAKELSNVRTQGAARAACDFPDVSKLDSTEALLIHNLVERLEAEGCSVEVTGLDDDHRPLLDYARQLGGQWPLPVPDHHPLLAMFERLGHGAVAACTEARNLTNFLRMAVV